MNQNEKRLYLIRQLIKEDGRFPYNSETETMNSAEQKNLLRSLMNIRMPAPVSEDFLTIQDTYLQQEIVEKGITELSELKACDNHIYIWQGDITTLACDAIVNAANSQMLGCFRPLHNCIDNCIHTFAGIQLCIPVIVPVWNWQRKTMYKLSLSVVFQQACLDFLSVKPLKLLYKPSRIINLRPAAE